MKAGDILQLRKKVVPMPQKCIGNKYICMSRDEKLERRLRWLGHVQRMSIDRIAKQLLHWIPEERKKRGRPRITWQHVIIDERIRGAVRLCAI